MSRLAFLRLLVPLLAGASLISACSDSEESLPAPSETSLSTNSLSTNSTADETLTDDDVDATPTTTAAEVTTTAGVDASTTGSVEDATTLPGEDFPGFVDNGSVLSVVGVAHDDVLNVRSVPGQDGQIVSSAAPDEDGLIATGRGRLLPNSVWYEVIHNDEIGWVSASFVAYTGVTQDVTAEFLNGERPAKAETMLALGALVAQGFSSEDPPSRQVQSGPASVGDLGEITYDVIGLGDDALTGYRLHVFATPDDNGETFTLKSIEQTILCTRGETNGICR